MVIVTYCIKIMLFCCTANFNIISSSYTGNLATIKAAILSSPRFRAILSKLELKLMAKSDLRIDFILLISESVL